MIFPAKPVTCDGETKTRRGWPLCRAAVMPVSEKDRTAGLLRAKKRAALRFVRIGGALRSKSKT